MPSPSRSLSLPGIAQPGGRKRRRSERKRRWQRGRRRRRRGRELSGSRCIFGKGRRGVCNAEEEKKRHGWDGIHPC
jgi:hypothetical protein